ncbi:MAG: DUF4435 domain-containing protein [Yersiniaceae bacterium]|nr:DUF4435 domain-containing protein [Yersiniaceae bacterium]
MSISLVETKKIFLPKNTNGDHEEIDCIDSIIILGANGSGKSRLGAWLEMQGPQKEKVHRITAQRSLVFPAKTSPIGLKAATDSFHWSEIPSNWDEQTFQQNKLSMRSQRRYGIAVNGAENSPLSDFTELMVLLFSENYAGLQENEDTYRRTGNLAPPPISKLRKLQDIWEGILPHRKLKFDASDVYVYPTGDESTTYNAKALSDGERVIFYMIGQVLCSAENAIILIDEPEIHLHKAIQDKLWKTLEEARSDCLFVYLTHDLDFASSRYSAIKIFMRAFDGVNFNWQVMPDDNFLPDHLLLELVGNRKPVIFVEGNGDSHDLEIFKLTYPQHLVKPVGGCSEVIQATKAFRNLNGLHQLNCFGIIDRDYLSDGQIEAYARNGVYTLKVAEIENLFLVPELIKAVADQLMLDKEETFEKVKNFVIDSFKRELKNNSLNFTKHRLALLLGSYSSNSNDINVFESDFLQYISEIDIPTLYNEAVTYGQQQIESGNYIEILRIYNKKDLIRNISHLFSIKGENGNYLDKVRQMNKLGRCNIGAVLTEYVPTLI